MHATVRMGMALAVLCSLSATTPRSEHPQTNAYVDPRILAAHSTTVQAIITGTDGRAAAEAVTGIGGQTDSDLWLIDAVTATIPTEAVARLAANPAVRSIVLNGGVKTADAEGWVSQAREVEGTTSLASTPQTPATALPDGGFVSVGDKGNVLIVGKDGKVRTRLTLPDVPFKTAPLVTPDNMIFISSETKHIYALDTTGAVRWHLNASNGAKFLSGLVAGSDGTLYAIDDTAVLYAVDRVTGKQKWTYSAPNTGIPFATPSVGTDGAVYFVTDKGTVTALAPTGVRRWVVNTALQLKIEPFFGTNGVVYVASTDGKRLLGLDAATGTTRTTFPTAGKIIAKPALGTDGSVYFGTEDGVFYALNPNGSQRFMLKPAAGHFKTVPVLSRDQRTVYVALTEKLLFAFDTATGSERWRYSLLGNIQGAPVVDADDGVLVGSEGKDLVRIDQNGRVTSKMRVADTITQAGASDDVGNTAVRVGPAQLLTIGRLPEEWDGRPDVQATSDPKVWQVVNPAPIDVGADVLHRTTLSTGAAIQGAGVTVAVVDSGIFFDKKVKESLGGVVDTLYKGQADLVDATCGTSGTQYSGYCLLKRDESTDPYGHGTAVASVIWNNLTDRDTGSMLGVAPNANILSVRVLDANGAGTYETVIKGIQLVVANKAALNVRVMNLSMSGDADVPYFVDPINRAVEQAWAKGIVVLTAAGNSGPAAETITAPGNDPYVITVGAINSNRTPGYWADDFLPSWSATGPTGDGFAKPDLLAPGANVITFMYKDPVNMALSQRIVQIHPDNSLTTSLFRMDGTSMSTPIVSGIVALMLQAKPTLTPDQVKYRLLASARSARTNDNQSVYNPLQQGAGRVWAPDAVLGTFASEGNGNPGMNVTTDLAHGYATDADLVYHYQGPVQKILSDDRQTWLYYAEDSAANTWLGMSSAEGRAWIDRPDLATSGTTWDSGRMSWGSTMLWEGGLSHSRRSHELGVRTDELGVRTDELGIGSYELGVRTDELGIGSYELGLRAHELGVSADAQGRRVVHDLDREQGRIDRPVSWMRIQGSRPMPRERDCGTASGSKAQTP